MLKGIITLVVALVASGVFSVVVTKDVSFSYWRKGPAKIILVVGLLLTALWTFRGAVFGF